MKNIFMNKQFKTGVCIFFATLCSALIIIGCPTPFDPSGYNDVPNGMGSFSLQLEGSQANSRTIMPETANNQFAWYRLVFSGPTNLTIDRNVSTISEAVLLNPGTYTLNVYGYTSEANKNADKRAAHASISVNINPGQAVSQAIKLEAYGVSDFSGKGIFRWNIGYADVTNLSAVRMNIKSIGSTPAFDETYNFISGSNLRSNNAELELFAGYYHVIFTLEKTGMRDVIWYETLHIYENMTSFYPKTFTNDYFVKPSYTVTFDYNDSIRNPSVITYFHDEFTSATKPADPTRDGYTFMEWNKDAAGTVGNHWVFGTNLSGNVTLYARWLADFPGNVTISILTEEDGVPVEVTRGVVDQGETLKANVTTGVSGIVYQWNRSGNAISGANSQTLLITPELIELGGVITVTVTSAGYSSITSSGVTINAAPGTHGNPFKVRTFADLLRVGSGLSDPATGLVWSRDKFYEQTASIFLSGGQVITPKGTSALPFTGGYDGNGFDIRNLVINNPTANDQALFAYIGAEGIVENVVLYNVTITGNNNVGGIAAVNNGTIKNSVVVSGNITGNNNSGGIAGTNNSIISNSYTGVYVTGNDNVGGITGTNSSGSTINFCYSTSTVNSHNNYAGGIAGLNNGNISNCIALNPNITSNGVNIGRIAGNGSATANKARDDMALRITGPITVAAGDNGSDVVVGAGTSIPTAVFNGWDTGIWTIPNNTLVVTNLLPLLDIQKTTSYQLRLPAVRVVPNSAVTTARSFEASSFIRHNFTGGTRGWWSRPLTGSWIAGEMYETEGSGFIALPGNVISALASASAHQNGFTNIDAPLGNIGRLEIIRDPASSGNQFFVIVRLTLAIPVANAYITVSQPSNNIHHRIEYTGNNILERRFVGSGSGPDLRNGESLSIAVYVEAEETWQFEPENLPTVHYPYPVFHYMNPAYAGTPNYKGVYYWMDGDLSKSSDGNIQFRVFNPPELQAIIDAPNQTIPNGTIHIRVTEGSTGATWVGDPVGPDISGITTTWTQPLIYGHTYTNPDVVGVVSRMTQPITLGNGDNVGYAEIILTKATTSQVGAGTTATYRFDTGTNNIEAKVILHLNPEFDQFVKSFTISGLNTGTTVSAGTLDVPNRTFNLTRDGANSTASLFSYIINFVY